MASIDPFLSQTTANRQRYLQQGDDVNSQLARKQGQYDNLENDYRGQADQAYGDLAQTPGYNGAESQAITGNPNAGFNYYDPNALSSDVDQNDQRLTDSTLDYGDALGGAAGALKGDTYNAANSEKGNLENAASKGGADVSRVAGDELGNLGGTYSYLRDQNDSAYGGLDSGLKSAVDPSKLGLSDQFKQDYAFTPEEGQNIKDVAGNTVRGQYSKLSDEIDRRAAAEGNSSPAAIAAAKEQLMRQGNIDAGDAMSIAELNANKEKAARAQSQEQMRLGANQDLSTRQQQNATNLYGAKTGAATGLSNLEAQGTQHAAGTQLAGASKAADLGYNSALQGGAALTGAVQTGDQAVTDASDKSGQANIQNAAYSGAQKLATDTGNQATGQGLAVNADNTASNRATGVAGQRIAGQDKYRGYLTGEQGTAQQGGQSTTGSTLTNNANTNSAINQSTATAGAATTANNANNTSGANANKSLVGGLFSTFFADGGIVDQPTDAVLGEHGPEMVVPLGGDSGYGAQPQQPPMGGSAPQIRRYGQPSPPDSMQNPPQPQHQSFGQTMANGMMNGWRGDGQSVPGNQPGGANGMYGRYGQTPDQQPSSMAHSMIQSAANKFSKSPGGQMMGSMMHHGQDQPQGGMDQTGGPAQPQSQGMDPQMAKGGIVTKPTRAIIGENGPEAVVPLKNPNAKITPEMVMPRRYNPTGETGLKGPMRPLPSMMAQSSGWKRYDMSHHAR